MYCLGVFLDLRNAFDVCSHEILLKKLKKMGIQGTTHKWFESYLSNRTQCIDIAGNLSDQIALDISVIQGSTLGPILFFVSLTISGLPQAYFRFHSPTIPRA